MNICKTRDQKKESEEIIARTIDGDNNRKDLIKNVYLLKGLLLLFKFFSLPIISVSHH